MAFMASALLDPVCERMINTALEEYRMVRDVGEEVNKLKSSVFLIKGVLQDAEGKQVKEEAVRRWLSSLKQVLYDAEDILDEAAATLQTRAADGTTRSVATGMRVKVRNIICCFSCVDMMLNHRDLAHQIKLIRSKLDDMYKERQNLGLQLMSIGSSWPAYSRPKRLETSSLMADETCIIGRDDEKKKILEKLLGSEEEGEPTSSKKNVQVLALFGMGGVGKTTLAQLVFNDPAVKQHFQLMIWVCVSEDFDLKRITREMMGSLSQMDLLENLNWDSTQKKLKEKLEEKRFLLVLDDVWEEDPCKWESLYEPIKYGVRGSKIIVTTRSQKVSNVVKAVSIPLKRLSSEDLWPIFRRYAFDNCDSDKHIQLETVGRQIVERLKESPLAAKSIGRLLNGNLDVRHWKNILKRELLKMEKHADDLSPVLKLSYDYLPGHLKQCFAYCSLFPKDYHFSKHKLTQLWMAQQFIHTSKGTFHVESSQSDEHFDDLLYRSFFEEVKDRRGYYVMHDLIHDLAEVVSQDDCFRLGDDRPKEFPETVRHVSIAVNDLDLMKLKDVCKNGKLRTLLFLRRCKFQMNLHLDDLFMKLKWLRVLGLRQCNISELPASIGTLKHLRYVDLSWTLINKLPESFCCLYNLQRF